LFMKPPDAFKMIRIYITDRLSADRPFFIFQFDEQYTGFKVFIIIVLIVGLQGDDVSVGIAAHNPFRSLLPEFKRRSMNKDELIFQQDIESDPRQVQPADADAEHRFRLIAFRVKTFTQMLFHLLQKKKFVPFEIMRVPLYFRHGTGELDAVLVLIDFVFRDIRHNNFYLSILYSSIINKIIELCIMILIYILYLNCIFIVVV